MGHSHRAVIYGWAHNPSQASQNLLRLLLKQLRGAFFSWGYNPERVMKARVVYGWFCLHVGTVYLTMMPIWRKIAEPKLQEETECS
jgi:hypothetical protein